MAAEPQYSPFEQDLSRIDQDLLALDDELQELEDSLDASEDELLQRLLGTRQDQERIALRLDNLQYEAEERAGQSALHALLMVCQLLPCETHEEQAVRDACISVEKLLVAAQKQQ